MVTEETPIKLRLDVDYPYPSRAKSFLYIALRIKSRKSNDYLKNAHIIAKMINESPRKVKAYWFFTPYTIPNEKLLSLLNEDKHEVALHVANKPFEEWKNLEEPTKRKINYYTIHGTSRLLGQLIWRRKRGQGQAVIPADFPLKSFHDFQTVSLDTIRYDHGFEKAREAAETVIRKGMVLLIHPEWLFQASESNHRGPFYDVLKATLDVDHDLEGIRIRRKGFLKIANDMQEYEKNVFPSEEFLEKLAEREVDVFTFLERRWCCPICNAPSSWIRTKDNVALLEIKDYESWWKGIGKKTRNMVRRAEKSGVKVTVVEPSEKLAEGIWKIYNETPVRQERAFPHYGEPLQTVVGNTLTAQNSTFIGAYIGEELAGFAQILFGENIAITSQILSMQKHWDKAINNALLAKAVEICASKGVFWLMYGRMGNHPSLDRFKNSNGFVKFPLARYYVPLTGKGRIAVRLGLHRDFKDALPDRVKYTVIPVLNWLSRTMVRLKKR